MDPRKLLYLATIIEQGSINKAAQLLNVSQPALSTAITRFERGLGGRLLERSPAGIVPTALGESLYAHARLIRDELEHAEMRLDARDSRERSAITFGTLPSLATSIIPEAVCEWRKTHKAVTLRIVEKNQIGLLLSLLRGELDFIVAQTELYGFLEGLRQRVLFRDYLHVFARPDNPVHDVPSLDWKTLATYPWVIQMVGRYRTVLDRAVAAAGVELAEEKTECHSVEIIKSLVIGTDALALLPACAIANDLSEGKLRLVNIIDPLLNRDIAVLFRDGLSLTDADNALLRLIERAGLNVDQAMDLTRKDYNIGP